MPDKAKKILIIRNDKLGDFMLAYPSFALTKLNITEAKIFALVPEYTREMAELCPWIDEVIIDPGQSSGISGISYLIGLIRNKNIDYAISLYSTTRIALVLFLSGIQYRLAPATKLAQIFYSHRLLQRRSLSEKPEYVYNMDLVCNFLHSMGKHTIKYPHLPYLQFDAEYIQDLKRTFCENHSINPSLKNVFVHPGSGGSATNLSLEQYAQLILSLRSSGGHNVIVTAGPGEEKIAKNLSKKIHTVSHAIYISTEGLKVFAQHIQFADLFLSGSTGPLHIAGALNVATVGFYPRRRSATPLRWQTLNSEQRRLSFSPPPGEEDSDMGRVDIESAADTINKRFL